MGTLSFSLFITFGDIGTLAMVQPQKIDIYAGVHWNKIPEGVSAEGVIDTFAFDEQFVATSAGYNGIGVVYARYEVMMNCTHCNQFTCMGTHIVLVPME